MNFVFDVDGTLTSSRSQMDSYFANFFLEFCAKNTVYLVTGSDYPKTIEQVGKDICFAVEGVFNCSGNMLTKRNVVVYTNQFELLDEERVMLESELRVSKFPIRTGNHIENRPGLVNFSIVGRNAKNAEREMYKHWDDETNERRRICDVLNTLFPRIECVKGGETGIDISLKGMNKGQIKQHIARPIIFFGDKCEPGGNDYPLAILADKYYNVKTWEETEYILRMEYNDSRRPRT